MEAADTDWTVHSFPPIETVGWFVAMSPRLAPEMVITWPVAVGPLSRATPLTTGGKSATKKLVLTVAWQAWGTGLGGWKGGKCVCETA